METKRSAFLTVVMFALLHPLLAFAQQPLQPLQPQQPPWDWPVPLHMWHGGWGLWLIFLLCMLFMIVICAVIFILGHRSGGGHRHWGPCHIMDRPSWPGYPSIDPTHSAIQILNERFAKGEIQTQEYEEKNAAILSSGKR
jgi:putative membrane protein